MNRLGRSFSDFGLGPNSVNPEKAMIYSMSRSYVLKTELILFLLAPPRTGREIVSRVPRTENDE